MKRLMWLTTPEREHSLAEWLQPQDIVVQYYNIEQIQSLQSFVMRARTIAEQNYIVVDMEHTPYKREEMVKAVQMLRRLSAARPIFLVAEEDSELLLTLASEHISNVIKVRENTDFAQEIKQCISENGKCFSSRVTALQNGMAAQAKALVQTLEIPHGLKITCSVAGTMSRIGTTTQAFAMCRYLKSIGFHPLLVDPNQSLCDTLQLAYPEQVEQQDQYLSVNGLCISSDFCEKKPFDVRIVDLGTLTDHNAEAFLASDLRLLVSGIKPWELQPFAVAKQLLKDADYATCVSFGETEELERLRRYFGERAAIAPWHPMPLLDGDFSQFAMLFLPQIKEICHA